MPSRKRVGRWLLAGGGVLFLLAVVLLAVWGLRLARIGQSLRQHLAQAQMLADDPQSVDPAAACGLVRDLRGDVVDLEGHLGGVVGLAPALGWLPRVGGDVRAAPHLLTVAGGLTEAGVLACDALEPALASLADSDEDPGGFSLEQVAYLLAEKQPELGQALAAVERAQTAWMQVDAGPLSPWLAEKVGLLDRGLPLLRAALEAALISPELLGMDGPRTYLVLAMNEDELRPIIGYITGVGEVQVDAGRLAAMTFRDGYRVDDFSQPYPDAPEPMRRYMGIDLWVFRDSNWSPDFPASARQAISLYRPGYPVSVDGVVAVDQYTVQQLVAVLEPLEVEGAEEPLTGETVVAYMRQAWAPEEGSFEGDWWTQRKSFMGPLAQAAWRRVEEGQVDWMALARTLWHLLQEKHLLIWLEDADAAAVLAELGWDGALQDRPGDFLMVVDASMGYNRASARVQEELVYEVDLAASPPRASLTLIYTHTSTVDYPCIREVRYDPVYEQMMDRCYWDYVQVWIPAGSTLLDATRIPVPGEALLSGEGEPGEVTVQQADEGPWTTLAVLALLPPSTTQVRSFTWTLSPDVVQWEGDEGWYALRVQKQPGTRGHMLTVRVRLPEGGVLSDAAPDPSAVEEGWVGYRVRLDRDQEFELHFRR